MLIDGLIVMLVGAGAVFAFLGVMILLVRGMSALLTYFPDTPMQASEDAKRALAILIAKKHRGSK